MKHLSTFKQLNESGLAGIQIPAGMQRKFTEYASKNWWIGKDGPEIFKGITDVKLMSDELDKIFKFSNGDIHVGVDISPTKATIDFCEITDDRKRFEKAADKVPYFEKIGTCNFGKNDLDVCISYSTAEGSSESTFSVQDIKDFIKLNKNER